MINKGFETMLHYSVKSSGLQMLPESFKDMTNTNELIMPHENNL
jgi:hypothetical protein